MGVGSLRDPSSSKNFLDKISVDKIGTGSGFTSGKFSSRTRTGLAGALREAKGAGRFGATKHLSKSDLEKYHSVVGSHLKKMGKHSEGMNINARKDVKAELEKMRRRGEISASDKKTLSRITDAMGAGKNKTKYQVNPAPQEPVKVTKRAVNFITDNMKEKGKNAPAIAQVEKPIRADQNFLSDFQSSKTNLTLDSLKEIGGKSLGDSESANRQMPDITNELEEIESNIGHNQNLLNKNISQDEESIDGEFGNWKR